MSYPDPANEDFYQDLTSRKEFYSLKVDADTREGKSTDVFPGLKFASYQQFAGNFINPNTPYRRGHLYYMTGTGKTLGALKIAANYINVYTKLHTAALGRGAPGRKNTQDADRDTPNVIVLGFSGTKTAFLRDLMKYTEFGFITPAERTELAERRKMALSDLPDDIKRYREYYAMIKKRITQKSRGGFFRFYGYDEFVNRLFQSDKVTLTDMENLAITELKKGSGKTLEDIIREHIERRDITVNPIILNMCKDSLLICDEIHNTYNMNMKNNRGVAIQYLIDTDPSIRFLSLSATPINNSPTEVVEFINYLSPTKVTKRDLFVGNDLIPGKLQEISRLLRGRVLFVQDVNLKYFPRREFVGEELRAGDITVPYFKFTVCPMSEYHQRALVAYQTSNVIASGTVDGVDLENDPTDVAAIGSDGYSAYDIAFPGENGGLFRSNEVYSLVNAPQEWLDRAGIALVKSQHGYVITGEFLRRKTIEKYSTKLAKMHDLVLDIIARSHGDPNRVEKIMIYHDRVKMSGVLLVQEMLKRNGFIDETAAPTDGTICCICGRTLGSHNNPTPAHQYRAARFIIANHEVDKAIMLQSLQKFDAIENTNGHNFQILIGSKIIKESYDFKCVRNLIMMSLPFNIPTFIQVMGRCIRKGSHDALPPEQRVVQIHILVSTVNPDHPYRDEISPEVHRYIKKLADYKIIQRIEREILSNTVDADINREIIMPQALRDEYFKDSEGRVATTPQDRLGYLYFEPANRVKELNPAAVTFISSRGYEAEVRLICFLLKRMFAECPVWTWDQLLAGIRSPTIGLEINPKLFSEDNLKIALDNLVSDGIKIVGAMRDSAISLTDFGERYIFVRGQKSHVRQIGKYYVLFPVMSADLHELAATPAFASRDKEQILIKTASKSREYPLVDVETYNRVIIPANGVLVSVDQFVRENRTATAYRLKFSKFIDDNGESPIGELVEEFLSTSESFQIEFTKSAIAAIHKGEELPLQSRVIQILDKFGVIVRVGEIRKYKETAKQYVELPADNKIPIGFTIARMVRLYIPADDRWVDVSKLALNRQIQYRENDTIIGYFEDSEDSSKFKLRSPIQKLETKRNVRGKAVAVADGRVVERGIVCLTKTKPELMKILVAIGVSPSTAADLKIKDICSLIRAELISAEIRERGKDSKIKYVYSWWDEMPSLMPTKMN